MTGNVDQEQSVATDATKDARVRFNIPVNFIAMIALKGQI